MIDCFYKCRNFVNLRHPFRINLPGECVYGWRQIPFTGKCIMIHEELKNWHDARRTCKSDGGDMLTVFDHNTNQFIWSRNKLFFFNLQSRFVSSGRFIMNFHFSAYFYC